MRVKNFRRRMRVEQFDVYLETKILFSNTKTLFCDVAVKENNNTYRRKSWRGVLKPIIMLIVRNIITRIVKREGRLYIWASYLL